MKNNLIIDVEKEAKRITDFMGKTFADQGIRNAVIGLSGGIDSATSFYLLRKVFGPENIYVAHLYYSEAITSMIEPILKDSGIPEKNIRILSIKPCVDEMVRILGIERGEESKSRTTMVRDKIRTGNIIARTRMIFLYDLAKKNHALVCGTENKSEKLLGYFTRFGDQASDIEPIGHLFKTQVLQLASYLDIPEIVRVQKPTAGLWPGQTDEGEFGFTYEEADRVLHLYFDKHFTVEQIEKSGLRNAEKIIDRSKRNEFKQKTPYHIGG